MIMELIRSLRERSQTRKQRDAQLLASEIITVSDFADRLFIAYNGIPLVPIEESWTTEAIVKELNIIRQNFINSRISEQNFNTFNNSQSK